MPTSHWVFFLWCYEQCCVKPPCTCLCPHVMLCEVKLGQIKSERTFSVWIDTTHLLSEKLALWPAMPEVAPWYGPWLIWLRNAPSRLHLQSWWGSSLLTVGCPLTVFCASPVGILCLSFYWDFFLMDGTLLYVGNINLSVSHLSQLFFGVFCHKYAILPSLSFMSSLGRPFLLWECKNIVSCFS